MAELRQESLAHIARSFATTDSNQHRLNLVLDSALSPRRMMAARGLARESDGVSFALAIVLQERDTLLVHYLIRDFMYLPQYRTDPRVRDVLRYTIETHPSPFVVEAAVEVSRELAMRDVRMIVDRRLTDTRRGGDSAVIGALLRVEDRAVNLQRGVMLPAFLRQAPPTFAANVRHRDAIRVLAFGDFGANNSPAERETADAMERYHKSHPFDFGITLGDNFYSFGLATPSEPRWTSEYEPLYGRLGVPLYPSFGNHDEYDPDSPLAEILYSGRSKTWRFPAQYYTYTAGPVQFFAIDGNDMSERQRQWLAGALDHSTAKWKVVYGHFPPYLAALSQNGVDTTFEPVIMPILRGRADVYLAGHHHSMQHLKPVDGVNFFIIGSGGAGNYELDQSSPRKLFAASTHGFGVVEATAQTFTVRFIGTDGRELYSTTLHK